MEIIFPTPHRLPDHHQMDWWTACQAIIRSELGNARFSISDWADRMHVSERQLQRQFERVLHERPRAYLVRTRLWTALRLLCQEELDCQVVAERVGFSSVAYFRRAFIRQFEVHPDELLHHDATRQRYRELIAQ